MASVKIPVSFEYEGIRFNGYFSSVTGGGNTTLYHLMISKRYYGQLWKTQSGDWKFGSNDGMFMEPYIVEFFAKTIDEYLNAAK
jgi:hypothetical protein